MTSGFCWAIEYNGMHAAISYIRAVKYLHNVETIKLVFLLMKMLFPCTSLTNSNRQSFLNFLIGSSNFERREDWKQRNVRRFVNSKYL